MFGYAVQYYDWVHNKDLQKWKILLARRSNFLDILSNFMYRCKEIFIAKQILISQKQLSFRYITQYYVVVQNIFLQQCIFLLARCINWDILSNIMSACKIVFYSKVNCVKLEAAIVSIYNLILCIQAKYFFIAIQIFICQKQQLLEFIIQCYVLQQNNFSQQH